MGLPASCRASASTRMEMEGLNLLCYQLSLDEFFAAGRGVDRKPGLLRGTRENSTRFGAGLDYASIQNSGDNQHSIPPCSKNASAPTTGAGFRKKYGG